jgi:hypothetical protein
MNGDEPRRYHAGDSLQDLCRACKTERGHTVIVADAQGRVLRVICDYCGSQHNYRGGERSERAPRGIAHAAGTSALPTVTERERRYPMLKITAQDGEGMDLEMMMRRIIREESGLTPAALPEKWRGGEMILHPGKPGVQDKTWPIDTFFHKVVMLRNRLRVLEQQINAAEIPEDLKIRLQGYITGCYGTLTSFNILFADDEDRFQGSSSEE